MINLPKARSFNIFESCRKEGVTSCSLEDMYAFLGSEEIKDNVKGQILAGVFHMFIHDLHDEASFRPNMERMKKAIDVYSSLLTCASSNNVVTSLCPEIFRYCKPILDSNDDIFIDVKSLILIANFNYLNCVARKGLISAEHVAKCLDERELSYSIGSVINRYGMNEAVLGYFDVFDFIVSDVIEKSTKLDKNGKVPKVASNEAISVLKQSLISLSEIIFGSGNIIGEAALINRLSAVFHNVFGDSSTGSIGPLYQYKAAAIASHIINEKNVLKLDGSDVSIELDRRNLLLVCAEFRNKNSMVDSLNFVETYGDSGKIKEYLREISPEDSFKEKSLAQGLALLVTDVGNNKCFAAMMDNKSKKNRMSEDFSI